MRERGREGWGTNVRPGNWSCDLKANERPWQKMHLMAQTNRHTDRRSSPLRDWSGPVGRFSEKPQFDFSSLPVVVFAGCSDCTDHNLTIMKYELICSGHCMNSQQHIFVTYFCIFVCYEIIYNDKMLVWSCWVLKPGSRRMWLMYVAEFLNDNVWPPCDGAKFLWLCAKFWDFCVQAGKVMIFFVF